MPLCMHAYQMHACVSDAYQMRIRCVSDAHQMRIRCALDAMAAGALPQALLLTGAGLALAPLNTEAPYAALAAVLLTAGLGAWQARQ